VHRLLTRLAVENLFHPFQPFILGQKQLAPKMSALFKIPLVFYRSSAGVEPVLKWLKSLAADERKEIGRDLMRAQWRWPVGMPLCRSLGGGLWEIRSNLPGRTARVLFCIKDGSIGARFILVGGWIVVGTFFTSGALSIPRRYAYVPIPRFADAATVGLAGACIAGVGVVLIAGDLLRVYVPSMRSAPPPTPAPVVAAAEDLGQ